MFNMATRTMSTCETIGPGVSKAMMAEDPGCGGVFSAGVTVGV